MRFCYFDDVTTGHHSPFLDGLSAATIRSGATVTAATPLEPDAPGAEWLAVPSSSRSQVRQGRKTLQMVSRHCQQRSVDLFVDLNLDKNIWILPTSIGRIRWRVHVLHHAHQYLLEGKRDSGLVRTRFLRRRLKGLASRGDLFVVHTSRSAGILGEVVPTKSILQLGYPVRSGIEPQREVPDDQPRIPIILFVGQARHEKGLPELLSAIDRISHQVAVQVVGPQRPDVRHELEAQFPQLSVIWEDRFVEASTLEARYRSASLVATPYRSTFGRDGGASGVLLEALAHGKPLLATTAVSQQLPTGYQGAVVVEPDDPAALTDGLQVAIDSLPELAAVAAVQGPLFIKNNHSFDSYVASLLERMT